MADMNITLPFEIQGEILKRVPEVKLLLRFRSVSKSWKCLIDSPRFIADYHPQPPRRHILLRYYDRIYELRCVSIIDNDDDDSHSFAQHRVPISIPEPISYFELYGSSRGLFCLYRSFGKPVAYLWNPSIRKLSVAIDVSYDTPIKPIIGFGVSPYSSDPKLVKIQTTVVDDLKPRQVEVYSLSTGEWRTLSAEVLPRSSVVFNQARPTLYGYNHHVTIGNFIFCLAEDVKYENTDGELCRRKMIILFDMISEKFTEIYLPDHMTKDGHPNNQLSLFKRRESLAVVASFFNYSVKKQFVHVWMMEGSVSDSFTKMYSIIRPDAAHFSIIAFRNNGHPIILVEYYGGECELFVYEPDTKQFTPIAASRHRFTWYAGSYTETLLLLDH